MQELYTDKIGTNQKKIDLVNPIVRPRTSALKTEITITDFNGDKIVGVKRGLHNMTVLGGRLSLLEKSFGIIPLQRQRALITDMIPDPSSSTSGDTSVSSLDDDPTYNTLHQQNTIFGDSAVSGGRLHKDKVNWFCIGNGGENPNTPYEVLDVHDWETRLYNMVPFRCVSASNDLSSTERANYRLKKELIIGGKSYYAYYAKTFSPGTIFSTKSDVEYVPNVEDSNPYIGSGDGHSMRGHTSEIYIQFNLEITETEFKEFYRLLHADSLSGARLTELGLISGYDGPSGDTGIVGANELYDATLFAKLVHDPVFMSSEGSRRSISYKVFA